jgi:hypothetical protein
MSKLGWLALATWLSACDGGGAASSDAGPGGPPSAGDAATSSGATVHVIVGFDDLPAGTPITNQYADHVTFSSEPGVIVQAATGVNGGQSPPNYLDTVVHASDVDLTHPLYVDFARPVSALRFKARRCPSTSRRTRP